jgi:cell division protein FtsQ
MSAMGELRAGMVRWLKAAAWVATAMAGLAATAALPAALRSLDATRVRRVEIDGVRYLPPQEALAASGIGDRASLFDRAHDWRAGLLRHPLVESVEIRRRLPATVLITVREVTPVALVRTPELRVVDARGRLLPLEPWRRDVDLPVLRPATGFDQAGVAVNPEVHRLLAELARLQAAVPGFAASISEVHPLADGGIRLLLRGSGADALVPAAADEDRLRRLAAILADLSARAELGDVRRLDARFQEQVVVAFNPRRGT